jgi:hypothetical protein
LWLREEASKKNSLSLPFPVFPSRRRLVLAGLVRVIRVLIDSGGAEVPGSGSALVSSLSLVLYESCNFCFAAFTLALDRIGFGSEDVAGEG